MKTKAHSGTTIIAVKAKGRVALATDGLVTGDDYPLQTSNCKISKLISQVYIAQTGELSIGDIVFALLKETIKYNKGNWMLAFRSYYATLRAWTEAEKDPIHKGNAKALLKKDAESATGIIISPKGIAQIHSTGEYIEIDQDVFGDGCGGEYAEGAARALLSACPKMSASAVARRAVKVASESTTSANDEVGVITVKLKKS